MMTLSNPTLDDFLDLLDHARRYERYVVALCPFHSDRHPSFFVYEDWYTCLSCNAQGQTKRLFEQLSHTFSPKSEAAVVYNPFSSWLKYQSLGKILEQSWMTLKSTPSAYLKSRGIDKEDQIKLGLGLREGWITFPIRNQKNKIVGAVARIIEGGNDGNKYMYPKGQDANLLYVPSWKSVQEQSKVYLTFGILDAVSIYLSGHAAMSTTSGKRLDYTALDFLRKKIIVFPDRGEEMEASQLASKLGWRGNVVRYKYPESCKDPNDLFRINILQSVLVRENENGNDLARSK